MKLNPYYITGICEGESTFTFSRRSNNKNDVNLYFAIKLTRTDIDLLILIRQYFGVGVIYGVKEQLPKRFSGYTRSGVYFRVAKIKDLLKITEHFDKYPFVVKRLKQYNIWKKILYLKLKHYRSNVNTKELKPLLDHLSSLSTRGRNKRPQWVNAYVKKKFL